MKNNKNLKIKILLTLITLVILSVVAYIYLPYISDALEISGGELDSVGAISVSSTTTDPDPVEIHEHRGFKVTKTGSNINNDKFWAPDKSATEAATYPNAAGKTGIAFSKISVYIKEYLSPETGDAAIGHESKYDWLGSLYYNTSIFCCQKSTPLPSITARILDGFHVRVNTNRYTTTSPAIRDYVEWVPALACNVKKSFYLANYAGTGSSADVEPVATELSEKEIYAGTNIYKLKDLSNYTLVRIDYEATKEPNLPMGLAYIVSYSLRNFYRENISQFAVWQYLNEYTIPADKGLSKKLYMSAKAVEELSNPVKPSMSKTSITAGGVKYYTGTIIEDDNYKIGPIKMNGYNYGWTSNIKGFSGTSSLDNPENATILANKDDTQKEFFKGLVAGIIEAKVKLDNGKEIILNGDNFVITGGSTGSGSSYYSYPKKSNGYEYPIPNSTFHILLPISECVGASKIEKITMTYKWHTADGSGGYLTGYYNQLLWKASEEVALNTSTTYHCDNSFDGYECVHDDLSYSNRSCTYEESGTYNVNGKKHNFKCTSSGYCQYGSKAASTTLPAYTAEGNTSRYDNKISSSCSYTWSCGYNAHRCGGSYSNLELNGGKVIQNCVCGHSHINNTEYYGGCKRLTCTKQHTHASGCNKNNCPHKNCTSTRCERNSSGNTSVACTHSCTNSCCSIDYHVHGNINSSCYEYKCGHTPGSAYCGELSSCCKYKSDPGTQNASHVHTTSCKRIHTCSKTYCIHGFDGGEHTCTKTSLSSNVYSGHKGDACAAAEDWGYTHIGKCYGPPKNGTNGGTRCNAHPDADGGGHRNCVTFEWKCKEDVREPVQKLLFVSDAQVKEHHVEAYMENIPLVAKVEIDKFITTVTHADKTTKTFNNATARKTLTEATKKSNPVYVEADDYVTYKIVLKNSSAFAVKVKVDDILPADSSAYEFVEAKVGATTLANISELRDKTITVNAKKEASVSIILKVKALEGCYENRARIITRNGNDKTISEVDIDYVRTKDDNGPVVNHISTTCDGSKDTPELESSDWFILNNYNAYLEKYVYKYDQARQITNNDSDFTNEESITKSNTTLKEPRIKKESDYATEKVSDGNLQDTRKLANTEYEQYKSDHPVNVEKYETVTYAIRVKNDATQVDNTDPTGVKKPTQIKVPLIEDKLHNGLEYKSISAIIYTPDTSEDGIKDGSDRQVLGVGCTFVKKDGIYNIYNITTTDSTVVEPGECIEFYIEAKVVQSNMYLYDLDNTAKLMNVVNINGIDVTDRNISNQIESSEHLRMKDLVIAGKVWVDFNEDGLMNDNVSNELDRINYSVNEDAMKKSVLVRLYQVDADENKTLIRTTRTDKDGLYTFARNESLNWYKTYNNTVDYSSSEKYQRIDKANNKDANGKYTSNSEYNRYFIEFVYDGVVYKSTDIYAGVDNLNKNDGGYNTNYLIDSNAAELEKDREKFNERYEQISYDVAYDIHKNKKTGGDLDFQKEGHESYLMEDEKREMTSKSFILKYNTEEVLNACKTAMNSCGAAKWKSCSNHWDDWQVVIAMGLMDESKFPNTADGRKSAQAYLKGIYATLEANAAESGFTQMIRYLWLYSFNSGVDRTTPETDYLKYINLGLELREDVDLALSKDVYKVKTTINGEEMEYDYNLGDTADFANNYISKKPYGFEIYEADYKYRIEQYISKAVENFKGNGADELNIEVTYRINLKNLETPDKEGGSVNTKFDAKVHEVLDLYDTNFKKITDSAVAIKVKDADGNLIDKTIPTVEAWMFVKKSEAAGKTLLDGGKTYSIRNSAIAEEDGGHPTYVLNASGEYVKVKLNVKSTTDGYSTKKTNNFGSDGYNVAYITGMDNVIIPEGKSFDIYVKYVLDKDQLEITVDEESYENTQNTEVMVYDEGLTTTTKRVVTNDNITSVITNIRTEKKIVEGTEIDVKVAELKRSIKLAEKISTTFKKLFGRGTENIAQINAYSIWYEDGEPASLVDKDSNAGNIGIRNISTGKSPKGTGYSETTTSADDVAYYEDMTYKTGIEIVAEGTENTREEVEKKYDEMIAEEIVIIESTEPLKRKLSGMVWDDSRSSTLGSGNMIQYIGNGKYNAGDSKNPQAKANENVELNYKGTGVTELKDIAVRNVKAEFIEVINVGGKYYEEILTNVTWDQKQNIRTDNNGKYELHGFTPGTYIVRFTYGDNIGTPEDLSTISSVQKDMLIFNGQDYKSTKYTGVSDKEDAYKAADSIIAQFNIEHQSDARDDELRRLEVNSYSEVMTNELAEILKGIANGNKKLTPNSNANNPEELRALVDNTYMIADTRDFLVKAEKLVDATQKTAYAGEYMYSASSPFYKYLTSMKNQHISERSFNIRNVDFGIEYRPESEISLMKEIQQLSLITEDNDVLVDLHFETINVGSDIIHQIDKDKSTGYELVQFITNTYTPKSLINNIVSEEYVQGLVYIQIDEELLQGCTVKITYAFKAQNCSEVDRISANLNEIRYRDNKATDDLIAEYQNKYKTSKPEVLLGITNVLEGKYTASALAKTAIFADTYGVDDENLVYRERAKKITTDGDDEYYGRFVGYSYYTGTESPLDEIARLKFDKILDYIDTNLEYEQKTTSAEMIDKLWTKITSDELKYLVSHYKGYRNTTTDIKVTDIDGVEYKSMVVTIDDRNVDPGDPNEVGIKAESIKNKDLSRFLLPKVTAVGLNGTDDKGKENDKDGIEPGYKDYTGHIYLEVSRVLSADSDDDDKTYENMAEIVQFTTLTGRRTNFATTIGNANIHDIKDRLDNNKPPFEGTSGNPGSIEFITASIEPDTSATETITLIPPTGLMKNRRPIVNLMETAKKGVEIVSMTGLIVAIVVGVGFLVILVIRKHKKRRIK